MTYGISSTEFLMKYAAELCVVHQSRDGLRNSLIDLDTDLLASATEVLETFGLKSPAARAFDQGDAFALVCDVADIGRGHAIDSSWQPSEVVRADGKEQFEIFAAVQRQHERVERASSADGRQTRINRDTRDFYARADTALFAQVREIGRKAVA